MLNKVQLIGRLGKDPEQVATSNTPLVKFSLATNETWKDKEGNKKESTEWHNIVIWGKLGEVIMQYTKKGDLVYVEGSIKTRSWDDPSGVKKYMTEVVVGMNGSIRLLGSKGKGDTLPVDEAQPKPEDIPF